MFLLYIILSYLLFCLLLYVIISMIDRSVENRKPQICVHYYTDVPISDKDIKSSVFSDVTIIYDPNHLYNI